MLHFISWCVLGLVLVGVHDAQLTHLRAVLTPMGVRRVASLGFRATIVHLATAAHVQCRPS